MSVRRALVDCAVLSVQDSRVFYPCCKGCFSRIDADPQNPSRCRCCRCGYSCLREKAEYRYRLSLKVAQDRCIFGVTVFGACLNQFFGVHASELQRLVENSDEPAGASTRATLLMKAVEDCFIGRHFIFGIKVTGTESGLWFEELVANGSSCKDTAQFVATQMILPQAAGLGGCTVVSYYRLLLQKAAENQLGSTDPSKTSRPPATTLLLLPHRCPASSFSNATLSTSGLLTLSPLRSQHQDCTLTPTPPWQQSLGLVTSSAEQEEGFSSQDSGDESSRQTDYDKTPCHVQRGCVEDHKVTEERTLSPLPSLDLSCYSDQSFSKYPNASTEKAAENTPILNRWFSPSQTGRERDSPLSCKVEEFPTRQLAKTFLSSSLAWEDLPFSESLTEFLCEENNLNAISGNEPHLPVQDQNETIRNNPEVTSRDENFTTESSSVCQSDTQITESHSQMLLDITNTFASNSGGDRRDLSDQVCKTSVGCVNQSLARSICFQQCNQEDEETYSLSFEKVEEQLEGEVYDCSADLFSGSLMTDINTEACVRTVRTETDASPLLSNPNKGHLRSKKPNAPQSAPDKQKRRSINRDSLIPPDTQDLDFIPPAQSTPRVKASLMSGSPATSHLPTMLGEFISQKKKSTNITSPLCKLKTVSATQLSQSIRECPKENLSWSTTSSRHNHGFTPKRRFSKPSTHKNPCAQSGGLNLGSTARIDHKLRSDSGVCDTSVCDHEDSDVIVLPTPIAKTRLGVKPRRRRLAGNSSSILACNLEMQQGDGVHCKRTLLDQTLPSSSQRGLPQTGNRDREMAAVGGLDRSKCYIVDDEDQECDWSRDLFSDSV